MKKIYYKEILLIIIFSFFVMFFEADKTNAATAAACGKMTVDLIVRDPQGDFIPNANFEIYQQVDDVDGSPKPGKKVAAGKISPVLGKSTVTFSDSNYDYAIKIWTISADKAAFWFYNDLRLECGGTAEISEYLSEVDFVLRDFDGNLRKNTKLSVYSQREDADNQPIREKLNLIGAYNTGEAGQVKLFMPSGSRAISGNGPDHIILETTGNNGGIFVKYGIPISDRNTNKIEYKFSDIKLTVKDKDGNPFPANTKIELFKQIEKADSDPVIGAPAKEIFTNDQGGVILEYPAGMYAARIKGADEKYQYFWDLEIIDQERTIYDLNSDETWVPDQGVCSAESSLTVYTRDLNGRFIAGLKFELYETAFDADNNPVARAKIANGVIDQYGKGLVKIKPSPLKKYALKIYDKNRTVGDFWFFDNTQFICGTDKEVTKNLPLFYIVLRDGHNNLRKNFKFSLYTQKHDADGQPIKEKNSLVGNFTTTEKGDFLIYLAPDHAYDQSEKGLYIFTANGDGGAQFDEYGIQVDPEADYKFEYKFSSLNIKAVNAAGKIYRNTALNFYLQTKGPDGSYLGKKVKSFKTDSGGFAYIEYPAGYYAVSIRDDLGQDNVFYDINIKNRSAKDEKLVANITRIYSDNASVNIYAMAENSDGIFVRDKKKKSIKISAIGYSDLSLAPGPYLFTSVINKVEYGQAIYAENNKLQTVAIGAKAGTEAKADKKYSLAKPKTIGSLSDRLKGYILLQVESHGEAWYVNPADGKRYYLPDGAGAYALMRKYGLGITDLNLKRMIIGADDRLEEFDYDGDGLPDDTEEAIGTDMYNRDSDNDDFIDGAETSSGFDPLGPGKWPIDKKFSEAQKGRILLQVEQNGEAWYVDPKNSRRFYMKDGDSAYEIMRFLSLGVKNSDLEKIEAGVISN